MSHLRDAAGMNSEMTMSAKLHKLRTVRKKIVLLTLARSSYP
ncbi:MAG: hypothetical protein WC076_09825 [Terrimicrobiaceae bacterium]